MKHLVYLLTVSVLVFGCADQGGVDPHKSHHHGGSGSEAVQGGSGTRTSGVSIEMVESKKVCMVNNRFMGKDQIPVDVNGQTYFGCCENCKKTLAQDAGARTAHDPVTGEQVDKAAAVIGMLPGGDVYYFKNQQSFKKFKEAHQAGKREM